MYVLLFVSSTEQQGMHGIQLLPGLVELIVLFVDDIALISDTPRGLQNHLNVISSACKHPFLNINLKTEQNFMVFRNQCFWGKHQKPFKGES